MEDGHLEVPEITHISSMLEVRPTNYCSNQDPWRYGPEVTMVTVALIGDGGVDLELES